LFKTSKDALDLAAVGEKVVELQIVDRASARRWAALKTFSSPPPAMLGHPAEANAARS
jgi:hypothetical protein